MDILNEMTTTPQEQPSLEELIPAVGGSGFKPPKNSIRNRAATTAILTDDPQQAISNYSLMMQEGEQGKDITGEYLRKNILEKTRQMDMKGVMDVLADPTIPLSGKQEAIAAIKQSQFLGDQGNALFSRGIMRGSKGETGEAEDARLSSVDAIRDIYKARNEIQGLVNAHAASLDASSTVRNVGELTELYVMPFGNSINVGNLNKAVNAEQTLWQKIKGYLRPGTTTASLRQQLESIPPEKRVDFAKTLVSALGSSSGIVFSNDNQFAQYDKANAIFEEGGYGGFQEFLDNVSPLLDAVGIGQFVRGAGKAAKLTKETKAADAAVASEQVHKAQWEPVDDRVPGATTHRLGEDKLRLTYEDNMKRIELNSVVRQENPAAPAMIIQQSNPEQARALHNTVVKSTDDQVAEGLYGVGREQAIINDVFPQVATESNKVTSKATDIQRNLREELQIDPALIDMVNSSGAIHYTKSEKAAARAHIVNNFAHAEGLTMNETMSSFKLDGGRVVVSAVYGTPEGSFKSPVDAFRQAKIALRGQGVLDSEITVLRKEGLDHVPMKMTDEVSTNDGNYLVRVDTSHEFDPTDFSILEQFDVKRNLFDSIPQLVTQNKGSATRYMFDAASLLHPIYTESATVAGYSTAKLDKYMLGRADEFASKLLKFPGSRRDKINDYIKEANHNEIKFDTTDLLARGFSTEEVSAIKSWRDFWDTHFYLENKDVVRTLNAQGYQIFQNQTAELFAKPIAKNQNLRSLYDPLTNSVIVHTKVDGDILYNAGGTYAALRRPATFNGVTTEHMIVRNTPNEYLRKIRDTDKVLNYREGYFQVQYKAPKFVDEILPDGSRRTVAVAGDTEEASLFASRMQTTSGNQHVVRGDAKALTSGDDTWWDVNSAGGRIAQRHRGKLLEDAGGLNQLGDNKYIVSPVDSAIIASKSIAGRTVNRPMLDAAKARFMAQYERFLPSNGMGGKRYPGHINDIGSTGEFTSKELADARTTYGYINYLENGYINTLDDTFKAGFNKMANMLGSVGASKLERGVNLMADGLAPTSLAKNGVFTAYLALNPLRQAIIQAHQAMRMVAYNPISITNGKFWSLPAEFLGWKSGLTNETAFSKFVNESGILDAVDKHNLVRGTLTDAADSTNRAVRAVGKAVAIPRKVGFDVGEQGNLLMHAAAVFDRYSRKGANVTDKAVKDKMLSEISALSYEMNFAGDLAYNQTSPAVVLQFMQVPHKAFLQMTNRKLPRDVRARMLAGDLIMWGPPSALIVDSLGVDILPDNPDLKEIFMWGAESWAINAALSQLVEDKVNIDFSSLAPYDSTGWSKFFEGMYSGGWHDVLMNSPAGQFFLKDGSRFQNAVKAMGRYFGVVEDIDESPDTFLSVMNEVAKMSSGYSNALKAGLLLEAEKRLDQYGNVIDKKVNHVEAWAQLLGFTTGDTRDLYALSKEWNADTKKHREEVLKVYEDVKRYYAEKLEVESTDVEFMTKVTGRLIKRFEHDPAAMRIIASKWSEDLAGKDSNLLKTFMKRSGIPDLGGLRDQVSRWPIPEDQKVLALQRISDMENTSKQLKEGK